ncbi:HAD family hydrolase [Treponema pectinovorum]|uniref:HAD family hydrolase n=1 Tax=Treponema pectinovorum TaxID=164 RepID=UPI00164E0529|nr:HAD family hydrolase [Treponema pectinovorum]
MLDGISVIAFDIDGTLYSSFGFYVKIIPYFLKNLKFYIKYNKVRKILHKTAPLPDFYEFQARLLAELLKCPVEEAKEKIQKIVYDGMKPYFKKTKPFAYVEETFSRLKNAGFKIAILSDFPPEQKGGMWGLIPYCDAILGSEACGALKPSIYPFGILAHTLGVKTGNILYVGNSIKYDVKGAKNAGLKTAYIMPFWRKLLNLPYKLADINFSNYRQLADIVLKCPQ